MPTADTRGRPEALQITVLLASQDVSRYTLNNGCVEVSERPGALQCRRETLQHSTRPVADKLGKCGGEGTFLKRTCETVVPSPQIMARIAGWCLWLEE